MAMSILRIIAVNDSIRCSCCKKRAAVMCGTCDGAPPKAPSIEPVPTSYYCSLSCSERDSGQGGPTGHGLFCPRLNERRYLYRAAATTQQVFIFLQMAKLDQVISESSIVEKTLGYTWTPSKPGTFADFPYDEVPGVRNTLRVLSHRKADEALVYTHNFVSKLLKGRYSNIVEMTFRIKERKPKMFANDPLEYLLVNRGSDIGRTKALKITLPAEGVNPEEHYIWNIAGPENNFYDPIADWDVFCAKHTLLEEPTFFEFGRQRRLWDRFDLSDSANNTLKMHTALTRISEGEQNKEFQERLNDSRSKFGRFIRLFDVSIENAERAAGVQVIEALDLPEQEYLSWKVRFLEAFRLDIVKARDPKERRKKPQQRRR